MNEFWIVRGKDQVVFSSPDNIKRSLVLKAGEVSGKNIENFVLANKMQLCEFAFSRQGL